MREFTLGHSAVKNAKCCALHFDADNHPSNLLAASLRREELRNLTKNTPMVSARNRGSDEQNFVDTCAMDAEGNHLSAWLVSGSSLFRKGREGTFCECLAAACTSPWWETLHHRPRSWVQVCRTTACGTSTFGDEYDDTRSEMDDEGDELQVQG